MLCSLFLKNLEDFFREDRKRLDLLFKASSLTVTSWLKEKYKDKDIVPAYISVLHTFGRSLIFNPHIHMLLLDGAISNKDNSFIKIDFFSYPAFRKRFMKILLDLLQDDISKDKFRKIKNQMYFEHKEGFYVYAPPSKFKSYVELIKYVCRYVARPVMAESKIIDYDGTFVTFWYQRHNDDVIVIEKIHAYEFISRIIVHIPEHNYRQIRFYGAYHNSTKINIKMVNILSPLQVSVKRKMNKWRNLITINFKSDPLKCPTCNSTMVYNSSVYT